MPFDLANRSLVQKMSMLILGVAMLVSIAIGGFGDLMLRHLAANLVQARLSSGVALLDGITASGGAVPSPIRGADDFEVAGLDVRRDARLKCVSASFAEDANALTIDTFEEVSALGAIRKALLIASVLVFAAVAFFGLQMTRVFFKPLGELEKEVDRLAKGDLDVKLSALNRSDEIGHIARSMATIQESLVELARLKAQRDAVLLRKSAAIVTEFRDLWDGVRTELRNVKDLLAFEGRMVAERFRGETTKGASSRSIESAWQSWKAWLTDEPNVPRTSTA